MLLAFVLQTSSSALFRTTFVKDKVDREDRKDPKKRYYCEI